MVFLMKLENEEGDNLLIEKQIPENSFKAGRLLNTPPFSYKSHYHFLIKMVSISAITDCSG